MAELTIDSVVVLTEDLPHDGKLSALPLKEGMHGVVNDVFESGNLHVKFTFGKARHEYVTLSPGQVTLGRERIEGCMMLEEQERDCVECTKDPSKWCQACLETEVDRMREELARLRGQGCAHEWEAVPAAMGPNHVVYECSLCEDTKWVDR